MRDRRSRRYVAALPGLQSALAELSARITGPAMRRMNEQVDIDHRPAADVAREFLATWK